MKCVYTSTCVQFGGVILMSLPPLSLSSSPVSLSLSLSQPDVVELRQQMTPAMTAVQMAVLEIMKACVLELKSSNPAVSDQSDCLLAY